MLKCVIKMAVVSPRIVSSLIKFPDTNPIPLVTMSPHKELLSKVQEKVVWLFMLKELRTACQSLACLSWCLT